MTRILVVEDEPSISDPLSYLLQREGYEVTVGEDGLDAVEEFERNGAELVLLDLMLLGQPGSDVIRQVRQDSQLPVIMLPAEDSEVDKVTGPEQATDDS